MSWSNSSNNRSSIFETFHSPSFGDDERKSEQVGDVVEDDVQCECESVEDELTTTLWMSCSPGRDSTDHEQDDDDDEQDDLIPLSRFQTAKGVRQQSTSNVKRKKSGKTVKKNEKKEKDKNAPKKPMSAYSLFFRDTQSSIKSQNPQATFGDISRIVASMWESLNAHEKDDYNCQAEEAKQAYKSVLHEYNAKSKATKSSSKSKQKLKQQIDSDHDELTVEHDKQAPLSSKSRKKLIVESDSEQSSLSDEDDKQSKDRLKPESDTDIHNQTVTHCRRTGCNQIAVDDKRWDMDFCSVDCVVSHCKDVFSAWISSPRPGVKVE